MKININITSKINKNITSKTNKNKDKNNKCNSYNKV